MVHTDSEILFSVNEMKRHGGNLNKLKKSITKWKKPISSQYETYETCYMTPTT